MKKICLIVSVILLFLSPNNVLAKEKYLELSHYVQQLLEEGRKILQDDTLTQEQETAKIKEFITRNLDLQWMAKYSLGIHRRTIPDAKLKEFLEVYSQFVVKSYADLTKHYNGQTALVKKIIKMDEELFMVNMEIVKTDSTSPIKVDYLVHKTVDNNVIKFQVADIVAEGISLLNSQQSEFNNIILAKGIDDLILNLKSKFLKKAPRR